MGVLAEQEYRFDDILPSWRRAKGSLGSELLVLRNGSPKVLGAMVDELRGRFRQCRFDLTAGIAVFMAPSRAHEYTAADVGDTVIALCRCLSLAVVSLRSSTTRSEDERQSGDPDASFFVGEKAERFLRLRERAGHAAAVEATEEESPDLVVEVEHTHYNPDKVSIYRAAGAKELWDLATGAVGRSPAMHDLQAEGGARKIEVSELVPGVRTDGLPTAMAELRAIGGLVEFGWKLRDGQPVERRLLDAAGAEPPHQDAGVAPYEDHDNGDRSPR